MACIGLVVLRDVIQTLALDNGNVDDPTGRGRSASFTGRQILSRFLMERLASRFLGHFDRQIQIGFVVLFAGATADGRLGRRRLLRRDEAAAAAQLVRPGQRQLRLDVAVAHHGRNQRRSRQRSLEKLVANGGPLLEDQALLFGQSDPTWNVGSWNAGAQKRWAVHRRCLDPVWLPVYMT